MLPPITLLAIESSCDETAAAVITDGNILSNVVSSQIVHHSYGGVVPELASRAHEKAIVTVVEQALHQAQIQKHQLNGIAFTQGPGLMGSLLVGTCFAKALALSLNIPLVAVNHMEAHIYAHLIDPPTPKYPFLCLTVSGGHTQIVKVSNFGRLEIIGQTLDDAVGEAFDKCAKILGLPYPGGPVLDKLAQHGNPHAYPLPIPEISDLDFSFSGFKTAVLYFVQNQQKNQPDFVEKNLNDICASIQYTLIEILMRKLKKAVKQTQITQVAIAGGVAANSELRKRMHQMQTQGHWQVFIPKFEYCTDNAAMVAITGYHKLLHHQTAPFNVTPNPRLTLTEPTH